MWIHWNKCILCCMVWPTPLLYWRGFFLLLKVSRYPISLFINRHFVQHTSQFLTNQNFICLFSLLFCYIFQKTKLWREGRRKIFWLEKRLGSYLVSINFPQPYICFGPASRSLEKSLTDLSKWKNSCISCHHDLEVNNYCFQLWLIRNVTC